MRTRLLAIIVLPLALGAAGACTTSDHGPDVASVGGSATPAAAPSLSLLDQGIRWARCMREHGIAQPDPVANNGDGIRFQGLAKDSVDAATLERAQAACEQLRPVLPAADLAHKSELVRLLARCMREHGVENFPDPAPDGQLDITPDVENDPQFPAAKETCDAQEDAAAASSRPAK